MYFYFNKTKSDHISYSDSKTKKGIKSSELLCSVRENQQSLPIISIFRRHAI